MVHGIVIPVQLMQKKLKRDLMPNRVKKAVKELTAISHTFVKKRDSIIDYEIKGICCTCKELCEGSNAHAGHYEPNSTGGALLRYHPRNMHLQCGFKCNINSHGQQRIANEYTFFMIDKYGEDYVRKLRQLKYKTIKADILFYEKMLELYKEGDEQKICSFLESY